MTRRRRKIKIGKRDMNEKKELQQECKNTTEDRTQDSIKKEWWQEEKTNHQMVNNVRKARWKETVQDTK